MNEEIKAILNLLDCIELRVKQLEIENQLLKLENEKLKEATK